MITVENDNILYNQKEFKNDNICENIKMITLENDNIQSLENDNIYTMKIDNILYTKNLYNFSWCKYYHFLRPVLIFECRGCYHFSRCKCFHF